MLRYHPVPYLEHALIFPLPAQHRPAHIVDGIACKHHVRVYILKSNMLQYSHLLFFLLNFPQIADSVYHNFCQKHHAVQNADNFSATEQE